MTIAYITSVFTLHFSNLADELYKLTNGQFWFIEINPITEENIIKLPSGTNFYDKPYLMQTWRSEDEEQKAIKIIKNVDVLLISGGYAASKYEKMRIETGKLTFEPTERQLKRGFLNAFSKTSISYAWLYYVVGHKNLYKLCLSAFTANDMYVLHPFFRDKCYKFGYFTEVPVLDIKKVILSRRNNKLIKILWTARLVKLKHPEFPILMAKILKDKGYKIEVNIVGDGKKMPELKRMIKKLSVSDCVNLLGRQTNERVYQLMREHDIFTFTSNKREGWGAVLNEAMSCGCACVVSDLIGAAPYLIKAGINGYTFKTGDIGSFVSYVQKLIDDREKREEIQYNAYNTMLELWNPRVAAVNFCRLAESILHGSPISIKEGPCSLALPVKL